MWYIIIVNLLYNYIACKNVLVMFNSYMHMQQIGYVQSVCSCQLALFVCFVCSAGLHVNSIMHMLMALISDTITTCNKSQ